MAASADKSKPYIPLAGGASDGWSKEDEATATCFCGAVQLAFVNPHARPLLHLTASNHFALANPRPWPHQHLRMQLLRLP